MVIVAKEQLTGLERMFTQIKWVIKYWTNLKTLLLEEYSQKVNAAQLHLMISNWKLQKGDTL